MLASWEMVYFSLHDLSIKGFGYKGNIKRHWVKHGMEWNGLEWNGMDWNGMEWNGIE